MVLVMARSSLAPREVKETALLYDQMFCWKCAVLSLQTTFPLALTRVSVRSSRIGSGVSFTIGKVTAPLEQHIENLGFSRVDDWRPSSFQWSAPQKGQLNVRNGRHHREWYAIFMGPSEWTTFIKGSRGWRASKCRRAGSRLIGSHGAGGGAAAATTGLLRRLSGDSVRMLLASWISARRWVLGVTGGSVCSVGGVVGTGAWLLRNLLRVYRLYQLEQARWIKYLIVRL